MGRTLLQWVRGTTVTAEPDGCEDELDMETTPSYADSGGVLLSPDVDYPQEVERRSVRRELALMVVRYPFTSWQLRELRLNLDLGKPPGVRRVWSDVPSLTSLYRGLPSLMFHYLLKEGFEAVITPLVRPMVEPKFREACLINIKLFHVHVWSRCRRGLRFAEPIGFKVSDDTSEMAFGIRALRRQREELMLNAGRPSWISRMMSKLISEAVAYPLLAASRRQAICLDDEGYDVENIFTASEVMDGSLSMYGGLGVRLVSIAICAALEERDRCLGDGETRILGFSKPQVLNQMLGPPLRTLNNLLSISSRLPDSVDPDVHSLSNMLQFCFLKPTPILTFGFGSVILFSDWDDIKMSTFLAPWQKN